MKKMILLSLLTVFFALAGCGFSPSIEVIPPGSRERAREFKVQALHNWHPGLQLAESERKGGPPGFLGHLVRALPYGDAGTHPAL